MTKVADDMGMARDRDLVLPPNTFAYVLDSTKGKVSAYVGPYKASLSNTDQPVVWDHDRKRFIPVNDLERATCSFQTAGEGEYIVLSNPAAAGSNFSPPHGTVTDAAELSVGKKVNVPGPITFPLWPGQAAETIEGHHLRHNQYLTVRVYDPAAAEENASAAIVAPQAGAEESGLPSADGYSIGQLIIVKGTEVSFYMPPTGIEVVPDSGSYVREAVTLERLEYCVLLDESGEKRYVQGPAVVFPAPTEKFLTSGGGARAFQAIELNPHSGVYVKVVAEYREDGVTHPVGEELFITGKESPIYFPRAEHSLVEYAGRVKHFAVAIPEGEGRYVLDRDTGAVTLITGPAMFLPDPRTQVVVLRVLDPHTVELMYPGNAEALKINLQRAEESGRLPEGQHLVSNVEVAAAAPAGATLSSYTSTGSTIASDVGDALAAANLQSKGVEAGSRMRAYAGRSTLGRSATFSEPRTIVLDTKYEGAVAVNIWPGYAVLVVDRSDNRRVEVGPKNVLLTYDESLMPLELSTGRPKDDKVLMRTAYLRIINNQVGDLVTVETADLVQAQLHVSYRVNFEGDPERWFAVENYVKVLSDHCRSRLRNAVKRLGIAEFYANSIDVIRDTLLGVNTSGSRTGLEFPENGMRLYDVEVLDVRLLDPTVAEMFTTSTKQAIHGAIELTTAREASARLVEVEGLKRSDAAEREMTAQTLSQIALETVGRQRDLDREQAASALATLEAQNERSGLLRTEALADAVTSAQGLREHNRAEIERATEETALYERRLAAASAELVAALSRFGDEQFIEALVRAVGPAAAAAGVTSADLFKQVFAGTPFESALEALTLRPLANGRPVPVS